MSPSAVVEAGVAARARRRAYDVLRQDFDTELALRVHGDCMHPLIVSGARVRVRRARLYWPGDVLVVLDSATGLVKLHRCVGYLRRGGTWCVITRADASLVSDPPLPMSDVVGRVSGGECAAAVIAVPWKTRLEAARVFSIRALRWLGDRTRLLPHRPSRRTRTAKRE